MEHGRDWYVFPGVGERAGGVRASELSKNWVEQYKHQEWMIHIKQLTYYGTDEAQGGNATANLTPMKLGG